MKSYYSDGIKCLCETLFSNTNVSVTANQIDELNQAEITNFMHCNCFTKCQENIARIYIKKNDTQCIIIHIERDYLSFSKNEIKLLGSIPDAVSKSGFDWNQTRSEKTVQSLLTKIALPYAVISKFLRGKGSATIDTINKIILLIDGLTNKKYEGEKCTSGIIYTSQIKDVINLLKTQKVYDFIKFDIPVDLDESFYDKPSSYRYIDGKNNFYLVDNSSKIYGIIRINNPSQFSLIERLSGKHIFELIDSMAGRPWIAFNGINDDVCIYKQGNFFLNFNNDKWYYYDYENFEVILNEYQIDLSIVPILIETCIALSKLHRGSLILFPYNDECVPVITGFIDDTNIANNIKSILKKMKLDELLSSNILLNLLSSDGLSIFSRNGKLINSGLIINLASEATINFKTNIDIFLQKKKPIDTIYGGGRTQSALVASQYGLCIKVSEDGPISVFYKKHCIYKVF